MNYYLLDKLNKDENETINELYLAGKLIKTTLLNINFKFTCEKGLNEKVDIFKSTEEVKLAPIIDKKNQPKKSNRGKKVTKN